ncbi:MULTISPECIES: hypothetical protein [Acinetobacter]|uniref:hypothetical protein n=1 Tax=Acinetobacter TaxID=469 RepID=UPI001905A69E|nr:MULTISPECIES: hypothetical protein [Acinetobacter]MBJ9423456.1 hypothetical protein [Acinetobacter seifertii]
MSWFKIGLSEDEKKRFEEFQKNRRPSMRVVGRGTLTMSLDDARAARKEMLENEVIDSQIERIFSRAHHSSR